MTERQLRQGVVNVIRSWLGWSEANGKFRKIIDLYNTQTPLPRGYKLQYDDEWCAATVTAAGIQAGLEEPTTYPEWVQPTGSHDAYNTGDIVDYNGTLYRSLIDGNVWSPEDYPQGWEVYNG